jgi:hypothetical protein
VYQDSQQHSQHEPYYATDWSSLQLDFSEFLNQDFTQYGDQLGETAFVSEASYDLDFEALLASTSTGTSNSTTVTATTDSSSTLTPVDLSTRHDNAITFNPLITTLTPPFEPSPPFDLSTRSEYASPGSLPSARTIGALVVDIPTGSGTSSRKIQASRPTPPPSVSNTGRLSKTTSPAVTAKAAPASPATSDSPEEGGDSRKRKRERNTEAARRYRQRRQDRLEELEEALAAMAKDRDELRIKLARSEAETDILRGLMAKK